MKFSKLLAIATLFAFYMLAACTSDTADQEDREAMKGDSVDMTEGKGEGDIGIGDQGAQSL